MVFCAVINCGNRSVRDSRVSFYNFPRIIENKGDIMKETSLRRRRRWLLRLNRADLDEANLKHKKVCSEHFIEGKPSGLFDEKNPDWAPSIRLGHSRYKVDEDGERILRYPKEERKQALMMIQARRENPSIDIRRGPMIDYIERRRKTQPGPTETNFDNNPEDETESTSNDGEVNNDELLSAEPRLNSKDATPEMESKAETCVVFVPKACTFQGASPVVNGKLLDVASHLKKNGIKNTLYIRSDFLSDSQNTIPVLPPTSHIEESTKVLSAQPNNFHLKRNFRDYNEADLTTPELKQLYEVAANQVQNQLQTIIDLKTQNVKMNRRIQLLNQRLKLLKKKKISATEYSILTQEYGSRLFQDDDSESDFPLSADDSIASQDSNLEAVQEIKVQMHFSAEA